MREKLYTILLGLLTFCLRGSAQIITTINGFGGQLGYTYDGYPAEWGLSGGARGILKTSAGLYIAEQHSSLIRLITPDGIMHTIAGNTTEGQTGDGGLAINATVKNPTRIITDNNGNLYFVDQFKHSIRRISNTGIITTIAGYVNGTGTDGSTGDGGPLNLAKFVQIADIRFDASCSNLYIADEGANVIRKVNMATNIITTIAGHALYAGFLGDGGPATNCYMVGPASSLIDNAGNIYIIDAGSRIRMINTAGIINTIAGNDSHTASGDGGPAINATFNYIFDLALDGNGNLCVADYANGIRKINLATGTITRYAGNGTNGYGGDGGAPLAAQVSPGSVCLDYSNGDMYIGDIFNFVVRKIYCPLPEIIQQVVADTSVCAGANIHLSIAADFGTNYQWQGNTGSGWNNITNGGMYSGATATTLNVNGITVAMNNIQYRCVVTNSCGSQTSSATTVHVAAGVTPAISIAANTAPCNIETSFTATITNGGTAPVYQWKKNGVNVGTNSSLYIDNVHNGDVITCVLTSNQPCISTATATSNTITINWPTAVPTTTITLYGSNNVCAGTYMTFLANATYPGSNPFFQWKKNGVNVATGTYYNDNTFANGDIVTCVMTSSYACASPATVTSNAITVNILNTSTPSVVIASPTNNICAGTPITFTAAGSSGGNNPVYQWKKNNLNVGTNSTTYTDNTLVNGDVITCVLTSNASCATANTATSNSIRVTVNSGVASVSINAPFTTACTGSSIYFYANDVNGGSNPFYQWKKNGVNVGTNNYSYSDNTLTTGDVITCVMTSSSPCISPATATSNAISVTTTSPIAPAISIAATVPDLCTATSPITFNATVTNGGATPLYTWKVNNREVFGANNSSFIYTGPIYNGITISCELYSNVCGPFIATNSNVITINCPCNTATEIINTVPNIFVFDLFGMCVNKATGNLYYTEPLFGRIHMVGVSGSPVTVAGGGIFTGDGPALDARILYPRDIISDNAGNIYFCENSYMLRKLDLAGNLTTIIGNNPVGHTGDGGPASAAQFGNVSDVAIDNAGNIYVSEWWTQYIRRIDGVTGIVTTIAGNGTTGYTGDGGPGTSARLNNPRGIVCDNAGNVYFTQVTDFGNFGAIRKIDITTGIITTIAGGNSGIYSGDGGPATAATFSSAFDLEIDDADNLYVTEYGGPNVIRKIGTDGIIRLFAGVPYGGGSAAEGIPALLADIRPMTTARAADGLYLTHMGINIRKITCAPASISREPGDTAACNGGNASFSLEACDADEYQWQVNTGSGWTNVANNAMYNGANNAVLNITGATVAMNNYQYRCRVMKGCGNANSIAGTLFVSATSATPTININTPSTAVCTGTTVIFTATAGNQGTNPVYQWKKNGVNIGTNSTTFSDNTLNNGDVISCTLTSNMPCVTTPTAVSNSINVAVTTPVTPTVSVVASGTNICQGTSVTFTATANGAGTYQWKKNGVNVGTNSITYTESTLNQGDIVYCEFTAGITCAVTAPANSNFVIITVNAPVTPSITINSSATTICAGTLVNFTAAIADGGTAPAYQWKKNGVNAGTNNAAYSDNTIANGDIITCELTSNANCVAAAQANSNGIVIAVNTPATPSINITTTNNNSCPGSVVSFNATITNGGATPVYQWKINGANAGTNNAIFTNSTLNNGDIVTCELTSNQNCITSTFAVSNAISITRSTPVTPTILISESGNNICTGTTVRFITAVTNEGATPVYQWKKNGVNVGTNTPYYTDNTLNNGDIITCVLTSSEACTAGNNVTSNGVTMAINNNRTATINILQSETAICPGEGLSFAATTTNAGLAPRYQWKINGTNTGDNSPYYFSNTLANNDLVTCELISGYSCANPIPAISNVLTVTVHPAPVVALDKTTTLCTGASRILNPGDFASYLWSDGSINQTLTVNSTGTWSVTVTDNNGCQNSDTTSITTLFPAPTAFLPTDTSFCDYDKLILQPYSAYSGYLWSNGSTSSSITITQPGIFSLEVTDNNNCKGSNTVVVSLKDCLKDLHIPTAFTPNNDGLNDVFKAILPGDVKRFRFIIYNRWGNAVFDTKDLKKGWDGTYKGQQQPTGTFVWVCEYEVGTEGVKSARGTVTLIR